MNRRALRKGFCRGALLCLFAGCLSAQTAPTASPSQRINGVVLNAITGAPVARALVRSSDGGLAALTDHDGHFAFDLSTPAQAGSRIFLLASRPGYLLDGRANEIDPASRDNAIRITPESVIEAHVTATGTENAAGVPVQLYRRTVSNGIASWSQHDVRTTGRDGTVRFSRLSAGDYRLMSREWSTEPPDLGMPREVTSEYPPVLFPNTASGSATDAIHLGPGSTQRAEMLLQPAPYFAVHIPVRDMPENSGIDVAVEDTRTGSGFSLGFDPRSSSIEGSLPDGTYTVTASSFSNPGTSFARAELTIKGAPVRLPAIALTPNPAIPVFVHEQFTRPEQARTDPRGFIGGGLGPASDSNDDGRRAHGFDLFLRPENQRRPSGSLRHAPGRPDGEYLIRDASPGRYFISASASRGYVASATSGGTDLATEPLVIPIGGSVPAIQINLRDDTASLTGTLKLPSTSTGQRISSVYIYLYPFSQLSNTLSNTLTTTITAGSNTFRFDAIPPGQYLALALRNPMMEEPEYRNSDALRRYSTAGQILTLQPGESATADLNLLDEAP